MLTSGRISILFFVLSVTIMILLFSRASEPYEAHEGISASILTRQKNDSGSDYNRLETHYRAQIQSDGSWGVTPVDEGVLTADEIKFLNTVYGYKSDREMLKEYSNGSKPYPSYDMIKDLITTPTDELKSQIDTINNEITNYQKQLDIAERDHINYVSTIRDKINDYTSTIRDKISDFEVEANSLRGQLDALKSDYQIQQENKRRDGFFGELLDQTYKGGQIDAERSGDTSLSESRGVRFLKPPQKWKQGKRVDVRNTTDVFHLHEGTNPKGTLKNCLEECDKRDDCEGVVTNESHSKCWGKKDLTTRISHGDRTLYEKSDDGLLSPWDFGVEWPWHPWNPDPPPREVKKFNTTIKPVIHKPTDLTQFDVNCENSELTGFKLNVDGSAGKSAGNYEYTCNDIKSSPGVAKSTDLSHAGHYLDPSAPGTGHIKNLASHTIDCGDKAISQFKLISPSGRFNAKDMKYDYKCSSQETSGRCREDIMTPGKSFFDSGRWHGVVGIHPKCNDHEVLTKFKYVHDESTRVPTHKYQYTCCAVSDSLPPAVPPGSPLPPPPPPPPDPNVSTNGRCGIPWGGGKRCPGKQCCSTSGWCGGSQGTYSSWCRGRGAGFHGAHAIGYSGGKFDGTG